MIAEMYYVTAERTGKMCAFVDVFLFKVYTQILRHEHLLINMSLDDERVEGYSNSYICLFKETLHNV